MISSFICVFRRHVDEETLWTPVSKVLQVAERDRRWAVAVVQMVVTSGTVFCRSVSLSLAKERYGLG